MPLLTKYRRKDKKRMKQQRMALREELRNAINEEPDLWEPLLMGNHKFLWREGEEVSRWWIIKENEEYIGISKWLVELGFLVLSLAYPLVLLLWSKDGLIPKPTWLMSLLFVGFTMTLISVVAGLFYCLYFNRTKVKIASTLSELLINKEEEYKTLIRQEVRGWMESRELQSEIRTEEHWNRMIDIFYRMVLAGVLEDLHGEAVKTQETFNIVLWQISLFGSGSLALFIALVASFI